MADDDQSSLITALKGRDRSAWSAAVDRHLHEVYGFVFHLVGGDRAVAEELNQETWLEALDGIDHCDATRGSFRNWLFGIARKRVALYYRRRALATMPVEDDLVNTLRLIAEHNDRTFPAAMGMSSREFQQAIQVASMLETQKLLKEPETAKLLKELQPQYGKDKDGFMKAWMKAMMPFNQKLTQKYMQGMMFYNMLSSQNDSHYAGKDVKLGTPDRPIFWYKPTGADKYRVIYADLSVKDMTPDDVKKLPEAKAK